MKIEILGEVMEVPDSFAHREKPNVPNFPYTPFYRDLPVAETQVTQVVKQDVFLGSEIPYAKRKDRVGYVGLSALESISNFDPLPPFLKGDLEATEAWLDDQYIRAGFIDGATMHQFSERFDKLAK